MGSGDFGRSRQELPGQRPEASALTRWSAGRRASSQQCFRFRRGCYLSRQRSDQSVLRHGRRAAPPAARTLPRGSRQRAAARSHSPSAAAHRPDREGQCSMRPSARAAMVKPSRPSGKTRSSSSCRRTTRKCIALHSAFRAANGSFHQPVTRFQSAISDSGGQQQSRRALAANSTDEVLRRCPRAASRHATLKIANNVWPVAANPSPAAPACYRNRV